MEKKKLEANLAQLMDDISEIEGLIALDNKGKVIVGQTLTEMDLDAIAKAALEAYTSAKNMGSTIQKGGVSTITLNLDNGSSCIVGNDKVVIASMQGNDASTSIALILRYLKSFIE